VGSAKRDLRRPHVRARGHARRPSPPWEQLEAFLAEVYPHELGGDITCSLLFIDSGNQSNDVYQWVRTQSPQRVKAIKGMERGALPVAQPSPVDVSVRGKVLKHGLKIHGIVVPFFKSELYADLKKETPTEEQLATGWQHPVGYCHFFLDQPNYGDEHFKQLCSEQLVSTRDRKTGRTKREWQQLRARNEALDCRVYARAAAWELGLDRFSERYWKELEHRLTADLFADQRVDAAPAPAAPVPDPAAPQPRWFSGSRNKGSWFKR
jgi:phage terminase large subunit GpA-like protein